MQTCIARDAGRHGVLDDIEVSYNPNRKHTKNGMLSPVECEIEQKNIDEMGVQETRGSLVAR